MRSAGFHALSISANTRPGAVGRTVTIASKLIKSLHRTETFNNFYIVVEFQQYSKLVYRLYQCAYLDYGNVHKRQSNTEEQSDNSKKQKILSSTKAHTLFVCL
ncbi:hypothetical protein O3G_MSEX013410 [Manduca sexta]|uniref:Uncharacterized protein n=1 Tax=Manduca sexta TaxID=7130 RepID=A0A922CY49_MANSE|nr:hypothetical protein O3G_MSEX013410 [Manduca sexta]